MTQNQKDPIRLEGNRHVDRELLDRVSRIRKELEGYGLKPEQGYRIAPALGGDISAGFRHRRDQEHRGTAAWDVSSEKT